MRKIIYLIILSIFCDIAVAKNVSLRKLDVILSLTLFETCASDPHCRYIYKIDESLYKEMMEFKSTFLLIETNHLDYIKKELGIDTSNLTSYRIFDDLLHSLANEQFYDKPEDDINSVFSFTPIVDSISAVNDINTFTFIAESSLFSFYCEVDSDFKIFTQQFYNDKFNTEPNIANERFISFQIISLYRIKFKSTSTFGCKNRHQSPVFLKEENKIVCLNDVSVGYNTNSKTNDLSAHNSVQYSKFDESDECKCDDNDWMLTFFVLILISILGVFVSYMWLFIKTRY
jgi:hypothetical protein